jgi:hypothetical protein
MAGYDRSRMSLGRRTQQQTDTRESNGGLSRQGFMNYATCKLKFFKMGDPGTYHDINILPWKISSKNHPEVIRTKDEPEFLRNGEPNPAKVMVGDLDYVLDVMVHTRIGPNNGDYLCLKKNFGKPCPICERAEELNKDNRTKEEAKKLFAKRKCVYVVQELDDKFYDKGEDPKIFEVSHPVFSKDLQDRATACMRGKGIVNFADTSIEEGRVVSFNVNEESMGNGKKFKKAANFEFNERKEEIDPAVLAKCPSLDSMMVIKTYDQLKSALYGDPDDVEADFDNQPDEAEESTPARFRDNAPSDYGDEQPNSRRRRPAQDEVEDEQPTTRRRPARDVEEDETPSRRQRPAQEETRRRPAQDEVEADEPVNTPRRRAAEEPQDEAPARRQRPAQDEAPARFSDNEPKDKGPLDEADFDSDPYTAARRNSRKTAVDQDTSKETTTRAETPAPTMPFDDEEQPEDKQPAKTTPKREVADGECPNGYEFGTDCENQPLCSKCPDAIWSKCDKCKRLMARKK